MRGLGLYGRRFLGTMEDDATLEGMVVKSVAILRALGALGACWSSETQTRTGYNG